METKPVSIHMPVNLDKALNEYRAANIKDQVNIPTRTWAIVELLTKALAAEGIKVEEGE